MRRAALLSMAFGFFAFGCVGYLAGNAHLLRPSPLAAADDCQSFTETGKTVCGVFLAYWKNHGGLAQQGFPISGEFSETSATDGKTYTVQYFERAVFEKHPENQPPNDVLLTLLGSEKFKTKYGGKEPSGAAPAVVAPPAAPAAPAPNASGSLSMIANGYGQLRTEVGYGLVVMNTDPGNELDDSRYQVAAYDAAGAVLKTDSGAISVLLPNQKLGVAGSFYLNDGVKPARVDFQVSAGTKKQHAPASFPLVASNLKFQPDQSYPKVTGTVANADAVDAKQVFLYVIAYDASGKIIGSGLGLIDFIPAKGQSAGEATMSMTGTPARVEMYPAFL